MADQSSASPYPPLFEARLGLRLFYCARNQERPNWSFGPAPLSGGKVGFCFAAKGNFWVLVNGVRLVFRRGDLLVIRPGDVCTFGQEGPRPVTKVGLGVECDQQGVTNVLLQRDFQHHYTLSNPRDFMARFNQLVKALSQPLASRDWATAAALLQLIDLILRETRPTLLQRGEDGASNLQKTREAENWAMENLGRPFLITEWARAIGVPLSFFDHAFKQHAGRSPKRWIEEQRMETARHALLSTSKTIKKIAADVGYEDPFYFSRVFHKRFGKPPLEYRKSGAEF